MKRKAEIKRHKLQEKECAKLAAEYAATKDWDEACDWYYSAQHHRELREYLEAL
jgi:hypothetical protein